MKDTPNLSDIQLAYLAGLTDADGSIYIAKGRSSYPVVCWAMTHLPTIEYVAGLVDGPVFRHSAHLGPEGDVRDRGVIARHKPQYRTQLTGKRAVAFCRIMAPFMVTKRGQAELITEWPDGNQMDDSGWIIRTEILVGIKALNHTKEAA